MFYLKAMAKLEHLLQTSKALWTKWQAYRETLSPEDLQQDNSKILACIVGAILIPCALHGFYKRVQYDRSGATSSSSVEDKETKFWKDTVKELKRDKLNPFHKDP